MNDELYNAILAEEEEEPMPRARIPEKRRHYSLDKTHDIIQDKIAQSEPNLIWPNDETYFTKRAKYFMACRTLEKRKGEPTLVITLEKIKGKTVEHATNYIWGEINGWPKTIFSKPK